MAAMARAIRHAGEKTVRHAIMDGLLRITEGDGPVELKSRFRLAMATRA
jgi:hypothetical protein